MFSFYINKLSSETIDFSLKVSIPKILMYLLSLVSIIIVFIFFSSLKEDYQDIKDNKAKKDFIKSFYKRIDAYTLKYFGLFIIFFISTIGFVILLNCN